jgi:hypothetical protein
VLPDLRDRVTAVLGGVTWHETSIVTVPSTMSDATSGYGSSQQARVVDTEVLTLMGVPVSQQADVLDAGAAMLQPSSSSYGRDWFWCCPEPGSVEGMPEVRSFTVDGLRFGYGDLLLTAGVANEVGLDPVSVVVAEVRDEPTGEAVDSLRAALGSSSESYAFVDVGTTDAATIEVSWMGPPSNDVELVWVRLGAILGALLLMSIVITIGMALWAAEGRDERDTLVAIGAGPEVLARSAAWKALALTSTGSVLGVVLGWAVVRMVASAADLGPIAVPWQFVLAALIGVPLVITIGAWAASSIAQRARPVTASTMSD